MNGEYLQPPLEVNPKTIEALFTSYMEAQFPGWEAARGNLDGAIGKAFAQIIAQLLEAASDGATSFYMLFGARVIGLPPEEATSATGTTNWTLTDTLGHIIPIGTAIRFNNGSGERVTFLTTEEVTVAFGVSTASIPVEAETPGAAGSSVEGEATELQTPLDFVSSVTVPTPTSGGRDAETAEAYLIRLTEELETLTPKPITTSDFSKLLIRKHKVGRAITIGGFYSGVTTTVANCHVTSGSNVLTLSSPSEIITDGSSVKGTDIPADTTVLSTKGTEVIMSANATGTSTTVLAEFGGLLRNGGYVTSWIADEEGNKYSNEKMAEIEEAVQEECLSGVIFGIRAPTDTTVNVVIEAYVWPGESTTAAQEAIEAAVSAYLASSKWGEPANSRRGIWMNEHSVRLSSVTAQAMTAPGMHYVANVELNSAKADLLLPGFVPVTKLGTLSVTVNTG